MTAISAHDVERFRSLAAQVEASFDQVIGSPDRVAILHYPYDGNVGNHMMWVAIDRYLRRRGIDIAYAAHSDNFDVEAMRGAIGDDPVLFIGGVTLSRLWPAHAQTKRTVAAACPENRLISLTSTMLFIDEDDARHAATTFGEHRNVVLMAREEVSAGHVRRAFGDSVEIVVAPESALCLDPLTDVEAVEPIHQVLWLHRDDLEGRGTPEPTGVQVFDWGDIWDPIYRDAYIRLRACGALSRVRDLTGARMPGAANRLMSWIYGDASRRVMHAGARFLLSGKVLVTDRMHPHILSALVGQPVVLLPDKYGKNRSIYDASTSAFDTVHWADDPETALEMAMELARQSNR